VLKDVTLQVRAGEILGIAGVEGNGQVELAEGSPGFHRATVGKYGFAGRMPLERAPGEIRDMGLSHIPQDRMIFGVASNASISENLISTRYDKRPVSNGFPWTSRRLPSWAKISSAGSV